MTHPRCGFAASPSRGASHASGRRNSDGAACKARQRPGKAGSAAIVGLGHSLAKGVALGVGMLLVVCDALAQYKVIGPDGRVTYTDRPPTDVGHRVLAIRKSGAVPGDEAAASQAGLPQALRQPVARFPVTLITAADCAPCDTARQQLQRRGVPYTELGVANEDDNQALQRLSGALTVPTVSIGGQVLRGWLESDWQATLDLAGYPKESALPKGWRWASARPLAARNAPAEPAPQPATPPAPPAPVAPVESAGPTPQIRF